MNTGEGGFNTPSRYAIWYRINKLAYGTGWTGSREDFVAWNTAYRAAAPRLIKRKPDAGAPEKPHFGRPVVRFEQWTPDSEMVR